MSEDLSKKFKENKFNVKKLRQKEVVRVWNLGSRLEPKTMKQEKRKPKNK